MIAKPCLDVLFLSYSHHHRLYHLMPCTSSYMHPNPSISDLSFCSCRPGYMLLLELFDNSLDEFNQQQKNNHLPTFSPIPHLFHNLTPSSLPVKLPLNIPIIPSVSKFHPNLSYPIYIPSEAHQPIKRRGRR